MVLSCGFWGLRLIGIDGFSDSRKNYGMGQAERPTCPHCGAFLLRCLSAARDCALSNASNVMGLIRSRPKKQRAG
jgi:hypothetical protein